MKSYWSWLGLVVIGLVAVVTYVFLGLPGAESTGVDRVIAGSRKVPGRSVDGPAALKRDHRSASGRGGTTLQSDAAKAMIDQATLIRWINAAESNDEKRLRIDAAGIVAKQRADAQGDYEPFRWLTEGLDGRLTMDALFTHMAGVTSGLGNEYDFKEKKAVWRVMAAKFKPGSDMLTVLMAQDFGPKLVNSRNLDAVPRMDPKDVELVFAEAAKTDPTAALDLTPGIKDPEQEKIAANSALEVFLYRDAVAASQYVGKLPQGLRKDSLTVTMVAWLAKNKDRESALMWAGSITDEALRAKALQSINGKRR